VASCACEKAVLRLTDTSAFGLTYPTGGGIRPTFVSGAGDWNGDGASDVVVGCGGGLYGSDRAYIVLSDRVIAHTESPTSAPTTMPAAPSRPPTARPTYAPTAVPTPAPTPEVRILEGMYDLATADIEAITLQGSTIDG
jgi:hypothetical protein